jgi:DNA-binding NtrC family response regulator
MSRSLKVLFCEDQPIVAADLEAMIDQMGHQPIGPARSLEEALDLADRHAIDAVVLDLELADGHTGAMVGEVLARRGVKVVVVSGHSEVDPRIAAVPHTFLSKPLRPEALALVLKRVAAQLAPRLLPIPVAAE